MTPWNVGLLNLFRVNNPERVAETRAMFLRSDIEGYSNCCKAIRDADFRENLSKLCVETLVITGDQDPVTNVEQAEYIVSKVPNAVLKLLLLGIFGYRITKRICKCVD